jgi:DNA-binding MarR family transcriptional regulator
VVGVSKEIAEHADGRLRRQVFNVIREAGAMNQNVSLGELCSLLQYRKRTITDMLDSLTEGGEILRLNDPERGAVWQVSPRSLRAPGG